MKPSEAAAAVAVLLAAFPAARWSDSTVDVYERMLADLDYDLVRGAIGRIICSSKFLPTIAEIREAAAEISVGPTRSAVDAWGDVTMAVRRVGYVASPKFEDPVVAECVRVMGWRNLCLADVPESVDRARFCELYADLQKKQRVRDVSEPGRLLPPTGERALVGKVGDLLRKIEREKTF